MLKDIAPDDLGKDILAIYHGQSILHPQVMLQIATHIAPPNQPEIEQIRSLSDREIDVLRLLMRGFQNHEIAIQLSVSENTVRSHISNILTEMETAASHQALARVELGGFLMGFSLPIGTCVPHERGIPSMDCAGLSQPAIVLVKGHGSDGSMSRNVGA